LNVISDLASLPSISIYETDKINMKKFHLILAALLAIVPSTLIAAPAPVYGDFVMTKVEIGEVIDVANKSCPKKSGPEKSEDYGSVWAAEPVYQTGCRNKLVRGSEKQTNAVYKRALAPLSKSEKKTFRADQAVWLKNRYEECRSERNENLGGAFRNALFADCQFVENIRRTFWIERRQTGQK
jgi:uncharacterized protein YecT (DUF1311 family)